MTLVDYRILNGTHYHRDVSCSMADLLEDIRIREIRVRFYWGNVKTGKDWGHDCDIIGRIGRSIGPIKIPIMLYNRRSCGGSVILDDCIVKIVETAAKRVLYQHSHYHV